MDNVDVHKQKKATTKYFCRLWNTIEVLRSQQHKRNTRCHIFKTKEVKWRILMMALLYLHCALWNCHIQVVQYWYGILLFAICLEGMTNWNGSLAGTLPLSCSAIVVCGHYGIGCSVSRQESDAFINFKFIVEE